MGGRISQSLTSLKRRVRIWFGSDPNGGKAGNRLGLRVHLIVLM